MSGTTTEQPTGNLNALRDEVHEWSKGKGWWETEADQNVPTKLALAHGELSEALEEFRSGKMKLYYHYNKRGGAKEARQVRFDGKLTFVTLFDGPGGLAVEHQIEGPQDWADLGYEVKPEGFGIEVVDTFIRLFDLAGFLGLDLDDLYQKKMAYNETRTHRHGDKVV